MKTSSAKAKGRKACQKVKAAILAAFPELAKNDIIVASAGQTGEDLIFSPKARKLLPVSIEVKNQERLSFWDALKQADKNSDKWMPALAFTRNREKLYFTMEITDFLALVKSKVDVDPS